MTSTTTETTAGRVYIRRHGYATLQETHPDHSVTVRLGDGTEQHVPFGDWVNDPAAADKSAVEVKQLILSRLQLDLGESFHVASQGVSRSLGSWLNAWYGPFEVEITVTRRDLGPMTDTLARHVGHDEPYDLEHLDRNEPYDL
jgi:phage-related protein